MLIQQYLAKCSFRFNSYCVQSNCHQSCSMKKGVLRNSTKFTGKLLFFNKVGGLRKCVLRNFLRPTTLFKKRLWYRYFPVNFAKFLRTPFLQNTSGRLLLNVAFPFCSISVLFFILTLRCLYAFFAKIVQGRQLF